MFVNLRIEIDDNDNKAIARIVERLCDPVNYEEGNPLYGLAGLINLKTARVVLASSSKSRKPAVTLELAQEMRTMYLAGLTIRQVQSKTGYSYGAVHAALKTLGVEMRATYASMKQKTA